MHALRSNCYLRVSINRDNPGVWRDKHSECVPASCDYRLDRPATAVSANRTTLEVLEKQTYVRAVEMIV